MISTSFHGLFFFFGVTIAMEVVWDTAERAFSCFRNIIVSYYDFFCVFAAYSSVLARGKEIIKQIKRASRSSQQYTTPYTDVRTHTTHFCDAVIF